MPNLVHAEQLAAFEANLISWAAVHGCLCLGLRHPDYTGPSRVLVEQVVSGIEMLLIQGGFSACGALYFGIELIRRNSGE